MLAREVAEQLRVDFPGGDLLQSYVRDDMRFREAPAARQPMATYDPGGEGDRDYRSVLAELRERAVVQVVTRSQSREHRTAALTCFR